MHAMDQEYQPPWLPMPNHPLLVEFGAGSTEVDAVIRQWFTSARDNAMAYHRAIKPQTERFKQEIEEFDRTHAALSEPRRSMLWRLPALSLIINRLLPDPLADSAILWRCFALHLADLAELKAGAFCLSPPDEMAYALMAGSFMKATLEAAPCLRR